MQNMKFLETALFSNILIALLDFGQGIDDGTHFYRICQNKTTHLLSSKGYMCIEPEQFSKLESCSCSITSSVGVLVLAPRRQCKSPLGYTFNITDGNSFITDASYSRLLISELNNTDKVSIFVRRSPPEEPKSETEESNPRVCFEYSSTNSSTMAVNCEMLTKYVHIVLPSDNEPTQVSLGVVLGSAIAVFLIVDVLIVLAVVYFMKRRARHQPRWRPDIAHPMDRTSDRIPLDKHADGEGNINDYVGIKSRQREQSKDTFQTEEYEEVSPVGSYTKAKSSDTRATHNRKNMDMEERGRNLDKQVSVPARGTEFVPADEYEEVGVKTADKRTDNTETNSKIRLPKTPKSAHNKIAGDSGLPSYEEMQSPCRSKRNKQSPGHPSPQGVSNTYGNLETESVGQEKSYLKNKPMTPRKPSSLERQEVVMNHSVRQGTRKEKEEPSHKVATRNPQPQVPVEMYDNMESIRLMAKKAENRM